MTTFINCLIGLVVVTIVTLLAYIVGFLICGLLSVEPEYRGIYVTIGYFIFIFTFLCYLLGDFIRSCLNK